MVFILKVFKVRLKILVLGFIWFMWFEKILVLNYLCNGKWVFRCVVKGLGMLERKNRWWLVDFSFLISWIVLCCSVSFVGIVLIMFCIFLCG